MGGGNIGLFSILYASKYPAAKIVVVEPESSNFNILKKNISCYKNITAIQGGIWCKDIGLKITNPDYHNVGFRVDEVDGESNQNIDICGYSVNTIIKMFNVETIDIFKMDIEGSEFKVVLDDNSEEWLKKTKYLIMEIHDVYMKNGRKLINKKMHDCGFCLTTFNEDNLFEKTTDDKL